MQREEVLAATLNGIILHVYHSLSQGSAKLGIPENRLRSACRHANFGSLRVSDLRSLATILPDNIRDELREIILP